MVFQHAADNLMVCHKLQAAVVQWGMANVQLLGRVQRRLKCLPVVVINIILNILLGKVAEASGATAR